MKRVLIIQNNTNEGPGIITQILIRRHVPYDLVDLSKNELLPLISAYSAVIVLGGPDSSNDETRTMKAEIGFVQEVLQNRVPYFGICLGLQVLVKAAGSTVTKNHVREIGFRDPNNNLFEIQVTSAGSRDPLCQGLPDSFVVFQLHGETVTLTDSMQLLGSGTWCRNQIVKVADSTYGIQAHLELNPPLFAHWKNTDPDLALINRDQLQRDFESVYEEYHRTGTILFTNFLQIAGL